MVSPPPVSLLILRIEVEALERELDRAGALAVVGRVRAASQMSSYSSDSPSAGSPARKSRAVTCSPVVTMTPPSIASTSTPKSRPAEVRAHGLGGRGAQQVVEDLVLAALLARLELDLAAEHVDRGLEVDGACDRIVLALPAGAVDGGGRDGLGPGDREPGADAAALVDRARLAQGAGEPGEDLDQVVGHVGDEVGLLADDRDLVVELGRVVGADLGAEAVLERSDDAAAVGVVLGVGAGHDEHVERQPQHVAADLDVALLHHVEHRDLDALGEVGQLVDRDDAAVAARDEPEVDGLGVAEAAALGHLHRVDVADQVGDARVGCRELLGVALVAGAPGDGQVVAELGRATNARVDDRLVRVLAQLGSLDDRATTHPAGRPGCAAVGSCPGPARPAARCRGRRSARAPVAG